MSLFFNDLAIYIFGSGGAIVAEIVDLGRVCWPDSDSGMMRSRAWFGLGTWHALADRSITRESGAREFQASAIEGDRARRRPHASLSPPLHLD